MEGSENTEFVMYFYFILFSGFFFGYRSMPLYGMLSGKVLLCSFLFTRQFSGLGRKHTTLSYVASMVTALSSLERLTENY